MKSLFKNIPQRILPQEYGGEAGPIDDLISMHNYVLFHFKDHMLKILRRSHTCFLHASQTYILNKLALSNLTYTFYEMATCALLFHRKNKERYRKFQGLVS